MSLEPSLRRRAGEIFLGSVASSLLVLLYGRVEAAWVWVGFVALVPWLAVLHRLRTVWQALAAGWVLSVVFTGIVFGWFADSLREYAQSSGGWAYWLVLLLCAPVLQPQFITAALARHLTRRAAPEGAFLRVGLTAALVYVGTEWAWPKLFADTLGHGLHGSVWLRQGADVAGAHGLTAVLFLVNECVLAAMRAFAAQGGRWPGGKPLRAPLGVAVALLATLAGYGALRYRYVSAQAGTGPGLTVGVVQANITNYGQLAAKLGTFDALRMILDTHYTLSDELMKNTRPDLLVWPETVYPTTFGSPKSEEGEEFDRELITFVGERQMPLIFGAYELAQEREFNAAMFLGPVGQEDEKRLEFASYRKTLLFPLTEWIPEAVDTPLLRGLLPWLGTWKRGPGPQSLDFPLRGGRVLKVAPLICYEAIFPGYVAQAVSQGAELIVTLSNDSWFGTSAGPRLHLTVAAFRSIETRLPQVRATNSGISALITPTGDITREAQVGQRAGVLMTVPPTRHIGTLMVAWGDWFGPTALVLGVALLLASVGPLKSRQ
ncbi:apolipoprotein N-acyltransferase [Stigmatella sp. ncwal1]|uniref:Apolipoprotein N-acyltransferase n=1 Tax=Stigmatella ashevillensis TaxID=2995309 RepID=A0ABT5D653_9BACT|nr:apolipoprotein N-acyltransferase [Stigmatella ashevillena]MDC0707731.1 apolipoprotein N-acyltransferase [Stigmatella ashevillena]